LTDTDHDPFHPKFSSDGRTVYFDTLLEGKPNIMSVPASGGVPTRVVAGMISVWAISPDGRRLVYRVEHEGRKIFLIRELDTGAEVEIDIEPLPDDNIPLSWSPDGNAVDFATPVDETRNIWRKPIGKSKAYPLTDFKTGRVHRFAWSPDGRTLASIRHSPIYDAVMLRFDKEGLR
jgi:Tol biopolymer transport system component